MKVYYEIFVGKKIIRLLKSPYKKQKEDYRI